MAKPGSNKIGQTSKNLEKVGIEQNLDDSSSEHLKVADSGSNKDGQKGKSLRKVAIEQNLDDCSSSSAETVNKVFEVKNFTSISLMSFQLHCSAENQSSSGKAWIKQNWTDKLKFGKSWYRTNFG